MNLISMFGMWTMRKVFHEKPRTKSCESYLSFHEMFSKIFVITAKGLEPANSCVRGQDATTGPARHMWEIGSLNWLQFMLQIPWIHWIPVPFMENSIVSYFSLRELMVSNDQTNWNATSVVMCGPHEKFSIVSVIQLVKGQWQWREKWKHDTTVPYKQCCGCLFTDIYNVIITNAEEKRHGGKQQHPRGRTRLRHLLIKITPLSASDANMSVCI